MYDIYLEAEVGANCSSLAHKNDVTNISKSDFQDTSETIVHQCSTIGGELLHLYLRTHKNQYDHRLELLSKHDKYKFNVDNIATVLCEKPLIHQVGAVVRAIEAKDSEQDTVVLIDCGAASPSLCMPEHSK
eukprot:1881212-Amphidinium_carterae.1